MLRGWGTSTLRDAPKNFLAASKRLVRSNRCILCPSVVDGVTFHLADVQNMFENVSAANVFVALRFVIRKAQGLGYLAIIVPTCKEDRFGRRLNSFLSYSLHASAYQCRTLPLDSLADLVQLVLDFGVASLSSVLFRQSGLPIGGIVSSSLANLALSFQEHLWTAIPARRHAFRYRGEWNLAVCTSRYVDDLLSASCCLCFGCLRKLSLAPYNNMVPWDLSDEADNFRWLDVMLRRDPCCSFNVDMRPCVPVNDGDDISTLPRYNVPPRLDSRHPSDDHMLSLAKGRCARLAQLPIRDLHFLTAVLSECAVWVHRGHSLQLTRHCWLVAIPDRLRPQLLTELNTALPTSASCD